MNNITIEGTEHEYTTIDENGMGLMTVTVPIGTSTPVSSVDGNGHKGISHQQIIGLHNLGWGYTKIAKHVGCSVSNARTHIKRT